MLITAKMQNIIDTRILTHFKSLTLLRCIVSPLVFSVGFTKVDATVLKSQSVVAAIGLISSWRHVPSSNSLSWGHKEGVPTSFLDKMGPLWQGSPTLSTGLWPVRNRATQQEVSGGWASEVSSVFIAAPHCLHYRLSSTSCQISGSFRFS